MSSDEDFWISWEDFRQTDVIMQKWGMVPVEPQKDMEAEFEVSYYNPGGRLVVELHKDLFSRDSDAYGDFNALFSDAQQHAVRKDCGGMQIWTMNETDHFVYLVAHAFKHFLHGGFGIRQVCDIVLFGKKYEDEIDWQMVYQKCEKMHAACFTAALFDIGKKQLDCCPCRQEELDVWKRLSVDSGDLLADLMDSGIYGAKNLSRKHSSTITLSAVAAKRQGKTTEGSIYRTLFPPAKDIAGRYLYLRKFPFLLPIAWADRLWGYYKENKKRGGQQQATESVQLGRQRVELLKKYKIID